MVFQCPKSFLPTRENQRNLNLFFQAVERSNRAFAWEPRGDEWAPDMIRDLCVSNNLIHCVDPFYATPVHGETLYWRLHGRGGYRYKYSDEDLAELRFKLQAQESAGPNYIMFNNMSSKQDALRFMAPVPF
jgi:uncharacterized protein YecE (DUF72 family)